MKAITVKMVIRCPNVEHSASEGHEREAAVNGLPPGHHN